MSDADSDAPASEAAATTDGVELALGNEFASVVVRRVTTRNGVRLRIDPAWDPALLFRCLT